MFERFVELLKKKPPCKNYSPTICTEETVKYLMDNGIVYFPCLPGDKVAVKSLCECVRTIHDNDYFTGTGAVECPFENSCEFEDCDNANERVFVTEVESIYNEGDGWKVRFVDLCIEADIKDVGTSFFVGENAEADAERSMRESSGDGNE